MSLTIGRGLFGTEPAARTNLAPPSRVVLVEPLGRRVRAVSAGQVVVDSDETKLVHVSGRLPRYAFPAAHVRAQAEPLPDVDGHVAVEWDAVDAWFEEDERVLVHPRDPYHRIDTFATSRVVEVRAGGVLLARSSRARALHETALPVRHYLPRGDVHLDRLRPSPTVTECAYKGTARHWSVAVGDEVFEDVAWSYGDEVRREGEAVRWMIAFYDERVDLDVDGVRRPRPETAWSLGRPPGTSDRR